jgi:hypothetical protein
VDEERHMKLRRLMERLGRAMQESVAVSDEVKGRLAELHREGWDAVLSLEASPLYRDYEADGPGDEGVRIHVGPAHRDADYRLVSDDARWLAAIGISPTRHRSHPQHPLPPLHEPFRSAHEDG